MSTKTFTVHIQRPVEEVYDYAADPARLAEWGEGIVESKITSEGPLEVGSTFVVKNRVSKEGQEFINLVTILEPNQTFAFHTEGRLLTYTSTRGFSEKDGGTELTETLDIEPAKGIYVLMHPIVSRMAAGMHRDSLKNLKRVLES